MRNPEHNPNAAFLTIDNLSKSYMEGDQRRVVFQNVNMNVERGDIVAILGKSGSGKTTLLNLISGIDRVDTGRIILDGNNITQLDERQVTLFRRHEIGFIFQFFNLIPTLTVWENLTLPLELNGMDREDDFRRAESLLEVVGLSARKAAFPDRLSGGEQQRVAIARALVHDPLLILADEPTGNLDEETGRQVLSLLKQLTGHGKKNMFLVTHSGEAASIANRVFALHDSRLIEREHEI